MAEERTSADRELHAGRPGHEGAGEPPDREIRFWTLLVIGGILAALVVGAALAAWGLFDVFVEMQAVEDPEPPAVASPPVRITGPRLLDRPESLLEEVRVAEDEVLESYGWVDREAGIVRVPVDRAIEIAAEGGLEALGAGEGDAGAPGPEGEGTTESAPSPVETTEEDPS